MLQIITIICVTRVQKIFRFELQLSSSYWNIKFSRNCPKFYIFTKVVILRVYLQLFRPTASTLYILWQGHVRNTFFHFCQLWVVKGCGMGPWLVLVSPSFRKNVVATCKIGSFLCSLDNLLQKNVIVFFFGNQISKWRSFEKRAIFDLLFTFFSHQGKVTKIPSAHISLA